MAPPRRPLVAIALVALIGAGCSNAPAETGSGGGGGENAAAEASPNPELAGKLPEFAKCMRENGVNMPDPVQDEGGIRMQMKNKKGDEQKVRAAEEKCRHLQPNGGEPPKLNAQQLDQARKHAKCMREHGIEMPDPDENGRVTIKRTAKPGSGGEVRVGGDPNSQKFKDADKACRHLRPKIDSEEKGG